MVRIKKSASTSNKGLRLCPPTRAQEFEAYVHSFVEQPPLSRPDSAKLKLNTPVWNELFRVHNFHIGLTTWNDTIDEGTSPKGDPFELGRKLFPHWKTLNEWKTECLILQAFAAKSQKNDTIASLILKPARDVMKENEWTRVGETGFTRGENETEEEYFQRTREYDENGEWNRRSYDLGFHKSDRPVGNRSNSAWKG